MAQTTSIEWRQSPDFDDYDVSTDGQVRRRTPGRGTYPGRLLRAPPDSGGYPTVNIEGAPRRVHVLVASAFLGPIPPGGEVHHRDENRARPDVANEPHKPGAVEALTDALRGNVSCRPSSYGNGCGGAEVDVAEVVNDLCEAGWRLTFNVLAALDAGRGLRSERVAAIVCGQPSFRCDGCGKVAKVSGVSARRRVAWEQSGNSRCAGWAGGCGGVERPVLVAAAGEVREVREILRGLERIGAARQAGGWWRRAA